LKRHEHRVHQIVKETRRIKKVLIGGEDCEEQKEADAQSSSKMVFLQSQVGDPKCTLVKEQEQVLLNFSGTAEINSLDQITYLLPERGWGIDNDDFYRVYNVPLNYGGQDGSLTNSENIPSEQ
jgi:hypothetical protein